MRGDSEERKEGDWIDKRIQRYKGDSESYSKTQSELPSPNARDSREKGKGYLLVSKRVR